MLPSHLRRRSTANATFVQHASDEFAKLITGETLDEPIVRVMFHWCGSVQTVIQRELPKGIDVLFRACLEPFLQHAGLKIHGITGADESVQSPPNFESIYVSGQCRRIPKEAIYFVRDPSSKQSIAIGFKESMSESMMLINGTNTEHILHQFEQFVKEHNHLRGQRFKLDGSRLEHIDPIRLSDVILTDTQRKIVERHLLGFTRRMHALESMGGRLQRGILFEGAPGNGKSHLVKAILNEVEDFSVCIATPSDFSNSDGVDALRTLVEYTAPVLVIVEEVDIIGEDRSSSGFAAPGMATWMQMLDGLLAIRGVLTIATTNRPEMVEQALAMRPGRFDRRIKFGPLPEHERSQLIELLAAPMELEQEAHTELLSRSDGFTGAQIKEILQTARLILLDQYDAKQCGSLIPLQVIREALDDCGYGREPRLGFSALANSVSH